MENKNVETSVTAVEEVLRSSVGETPEAMEKWRDCGRGCGVTLWAAPGRTLKVR